ncbi:peptide-methionine (S)-S-oxide reductase MsrA [Natronorubrum bangense]|uniref:Peptide methionine sulfoxide reductase MsrA n=2 Tax=Natronorubrum bangense TaxID=61858 RepID=L9W5R9_9EURY|nr:peptide-methionine (S)-S-oxide reductase MsrA [Natronorubrum bangense]ELY44809.1 methionine sulfoxide reductase A [Natronorubrum bangense JCM 10635]QCC56741.1 peptide-methionine (S)-S-oxide reductase [Natronorubrum bangense]
MERATFGGGCFWCVEAAFEELDGVESVISGYAGGHTDDPSYNAVCSGRTGHAEVVQLEYDPETIAYEDLLEVFFTIHDPTTKDREGPDVGSQYRSAIYAHSDDQLETAEAFAAELEAEGLYEGIVTEIEPLETFYEAEEYHQNYFEKNPNDAYCSMHAAPKVEKVREKFSENVTPRSH